MYFVKKLVYELATESSKPYTYYTMAIYQNSYGMTDRRKPEFKLTISSTEVSVVEGPISLMHATSEFSAEIEEESRAASWLTTKLRETMEFFTQ